MPPFTISKRLANLPDIQRVYNWELWIPSIEQLGLDDTILKCRTAQIPARGNEPIESVFMGMKQFFPGKPTFENTLTVQFEEFEDNKIKVGMYSWQQLIFDIETNGAGLGVSKRDVSRDVDLKMYSYNGDDLATIRFFNTWIQNIGAVALDYNANESVKYDATFQFDTWELVNP